tara:strand:- start:3140 stop:4516 length:1377 start_codon:yes stop_codon:yes gene_type:complete
MKRVKKTLYRPDPPIRRAWFVTAEDDDGNYPLAGHGCNVMPCRYARSSTFPKEEGEQPLTQSAGQVFEWVWTGRWVPPGTFLRAIHLYGRWWANESCLALMSLRAWDTEEPPNREWYKSRFGGVKVDSDANVVTIGIIDDDENPNQELYRFSPSGSLLKQSELGQLTSASLFDVDGNDNVYVVGTGPNESVPEGVTCIEKYDSSFNPGWFYNRIGLGGPTGGISYTLSANCIRASGGTIVTGGHTNALQPSTGSPLKVFDDGGNLVFATNPYAGHNPFPFGVTGPGLYDRYINAVELADGIILAGGSHSYNTSIPEYAGSLFAIDTSLDAPYIAWAWGTPEVGGVADMVVSGDHIYAALTTGVAKITLEGELVWHAADFETYGSHTAIDIDNDGNIYACGPPTGTGPLGRTGVFNMIKLDNDGNLIFKMDIFSNQNDIAVNRSNQKFYTTGGEVEDYC